MKPTRMMSAVALRALVTCILAMFVATSAVAGPAKGAPTEPKLIPASMAKPAYPDAEREGGVEGTVILAVDISAAGVVAGAKVDTPVDGHPAFSDAAIAAVKQWRFEPARLDGKPVGITVRIPVRFALQEK